MSIEIITTADGSHSLLNTDLQEPYHSVHGAIQESVHVFIRNGLDYRLLSPSKQIHILEVGFGTGLNALLTLLYVIGSEIQVHYSSLEPFPIAEATAKLLNYPLILHNEQTESFFSRLHSARWGMDEKVHDNFIIQKLQTTLQSADLGRENFDIVYFDAFAPNKQAEMWELPQLMKAERSMKPGAVFVTYCAKGQLKRDLKSLGLIVETLPGPPGKKEMVRALKTGPDRKSVAPQVNKS